MSKAEVIVKIEKNYKDRLAEIAAQCKNAGMNVEQQMSALGMISGTVEKSAIKKIEKIEGVAYVEESKPIGI
ncbi:MAG TPA: hypothetical protein VK892_05555 [Pyrinomonadaceae bacterium]|nr:hypothetical protein [Pyrinomonadaceae bacterium]